MRWLSELLISQRGPFTLSDFGSVLFRRATECAYSPQVKHCVILVVIGVILPNDENVLYSVVLATVQSRTYLDYWENNCKLIYFKLVFTTK